LWNTIRIRRLALLFALGHYRMGDPTGKILCSLPGDSILSPKELFLSPRDFVFIPRNLFFSPRKLRPRARCKKEAVGIPKPVCSKGEGCSGTMYPLMCLSVDFSTSWMPYSDIQMDSMLHKLFVDVY
jgi:hypothetical protein